jgi:hypothetical protein
MTAGHGWRSVGANPSARYPNGAEKCASVDPYQR